MHYHYDDNPGITYSQPETKSEAGMKYRLTIARTFVPENNVPNKNEWADALLSGDYEQGLGGLCILTPQEDGSLKKTHCCLGVEAELCGVESTIRGNGTVTYAFPYKSLLEEETGVLGREWANDHGFYDDRGTFDIEFEMFGERWYQRMSLAHLNDNGFTFAQIADLVRHFF